MDDVENSRFSVWAEIEGHSKPLLVFDLPGGRLFDDIVVPYKTGQTFFIDGAPVKPSDLKRIKILRQQAGFSNEFKLLHRNLAHAASNLRKILAEQYTIRLEALLRGHADDVTSQIIKAYDQVIGPKMKDYLPRRDELISAAMRIFLEAIKTLGSA